MILLDIPQGAITIASAILVLAGGALVTFSVFLIRELLSVKERLKAVETLVPPYDAERMKTTNARMEIVWESYIQWARNLRAMGAPENPMKQERWEELADKLNRGRAFGRRSRGISCGPIEAGRTGKGREGSGGSGYPRAGYHPHQVAVEGKGTSGTEVGAAFPPSPEQLSEPGRGGPGDTGGGFGLLRG